MGRINSKIAVINDLRLEPIPARRPIPAVKVVTAGYAVVALGADNKVYSNKVSKSRYYLAGDRDIYDTLDGCIKLGVLSSDAVKQFKLDRATEQKERSKRYAAQHLLDNAKEAGLVLTKAQEEKLKSLAKETAHEYC